MRTNNTFGVQFITRTNKAKNGLLLIYARISVDSHLIEVSLKRFISFDNWNDAKGSARAKVKKFVTSTLP
jgi:integrase/recombinase XerD